MTKAGGSPSRQMTLRRHLLELRNRLFLVAGILIVVSVIAYVFKDELIALLLAPLDGRQLQYLTPGGGFKFIFSVIFFAGLAAAIPVLLHQLYTFLSPVLSQKVRKRGGWLLLWSFLLLTAGVLFGYAYAVPGALNFLYGFADDYIVSALTADSYLDFIIKYTLGIGLAFQIPLIMIIIHWIKPQKPMKLLKFERWVILLSFIAAAIITPTPDPINQTIVAVPIILVYQFGLIAICLSIWRDKRRERKTPRVETESSATPTAPYKELSKPEALPQPLPTPKLSVAVQPVTNAPQPQPLTTRSHPRSVDGFSRQAQRTSFQNTQTRSRVSSTERRVAPALQPNVSRGANGRRSSVFLDGISPMPTN